MQSLHGLTDWVISVNLSCRIWSKWWQWCTDVSVGLFQLQHREGLVISPPRELFICLYLLVCLRAGLLTKLRMNFMKFFVWNGFEARQLIRFWGALHPDPGIFLHPFCNVVRLCYFAPHVPTLVTNWETEKENWVSFALHQCYEVASFWAFWIP